MLICFKEEHCEKVRRIYIPSCFISLGASMVSRVLSSKGKKYIDGGDIVKEVKPLTKEQAKELRVMLKYLNKNYKGLTIVDVETKTQIIKIRI